MKLIFVFCNLQIFAYRGVFKIQKLKFFIKCLKSLEKEEREREREITNLPNAATVSILIYFRSCSCCIYHFMLCLRFFPSYYIAFMNIIF